jgi:hypothetical protein
MVISECEFVSGTVGLLLVAKDSGVASEKELFKPSSIQLPSSQRIYAAMLEQAYYYYIPSGHWWKQEEG